MYLPAYLLAFLVRYLCNKLITDHTIISVSACVWDIPNQKDTLLPSRMHVMAGLLPSEADRTNEELMAEWEATYVKNMKYAAQRLEEVISHG